MLVSGDLCLQSKMDAFDGFIYSNLLNSFSRKRKLERLEEEEEYADSDDFEIIAATIQATAEIVSIQNIRKRRNPRKNRHDQKMFWTNGFQTWDDDEFKGRLRINRETFNMILERISVIITKTPTNFVPDPIEDHRQLALTLYRLGHGCSFRVLADVFGVSISLATKTFNKVIREIIRNLYDDYIYLPRTTEEWIEECKGFIENYEFPCVGAWDGFHVEVCSRLKNYYSFKNRYTVTNMGLIGHNKRFLALTTGAPGSTHDARLLRYSNVYRDIINGEGIPDKAIDLGVGAGEIPLITIGDSAFPRFPWLVKMFNENTRDLKERFFNKKCCSARVVTENCYGMMKGRWRIIYKKCECKLYNIKYVIMACALLHNICIHHNDPCLSRWKLDVEELGLLDRQLDRHENKQKSTENARKIAEWLWNLQ